MHSASVPISPFHRRPIPVPAPAAAPQPRPTFTYATFRPDGLIVDDTGRHRRLVTIERARRSRTSRAVRVAVTLFTIGAVAIFCVQYPTLAREWAGRVAAGAADFAARVAEAVG